MKLPKLKSLLPTIPDRGPLGVGKQLVKEVGEDDVGSLAAALAYRFFLALFPFFIFIAALAGFVTHLLDIQDPTDRIISTIGDTLPSDVTSVLRTQLESVINSRNAALLSVGLLGTLWAASSGLNSIMKAMNHAYDVNETRPIWERYLLAIGLTLFAGVLIVASFLLLIVWQTSGTKIADKIGLGGVAAGLFPLMRWPVSVLLILFATGILYRLAPNTRLTLRRILPGAVLFTTVWLVATYVFGVYVAHFASYNSTYGALGGVVVLLVWFYLTAFILLVGGELNAVLEKRAADRVRGSATS
ncbi:MAG TPA: YihY/virulence factor BrkB family protein [Dehalococcoidia bacterium]|nr:YihY/virulence factor BrkB family protein [Dehalococcoidia bacterium]